MVLHPTGYDAQFIDSTGAVKDTFSGTCHGTTPPPPGLGISQTAPSSVQADAGAAYTVTVTNPGPSDQTNVTRHRQPAAERAVRHRSRRRAGAAPVQGPITCNLGTLGAG